MVLDTIASPALRALPTRAPCQAAASVSCARLLRSAPRRALPPLLSVSLLCTARLPVRVREGPPSRERGLPRARASDPRP